MTGGDPNPRQFRYVSHKRRTKEDKRFITGRGRYAADVVVPGTTGTLRIIGPDGQVTMAELSAGIAYSRQAGVEHDVINANDHEFVFVEVEIK